MTQIAEAYFHVKRVSLTATELEIFGDKVSLSAALIARDLFPPDTVLDVRLEEGSVKGWVLVVGTLTIQSYGIVADYKGFKESIPEIVRDGKNFSEALINKVTSAKELESGRVFRRERRTKTPGKIRRLVQKREWLEAHRQQLSRPDIVRISYEIEQLLQTILADVDPEARAALRDALGESAPHVPSREVPRSALPQARPEEELELWDLEAIGPGVSADYRRRFRLSDALQGVDGLPLHTHSDRDPPKPD